MNKKTIKQLITIFIFVIIISGLSYAALRFNVFGYKTNTVILEGFTFSYNEGSNNISISDGSILTDEDGKKQGNYFDFNVNLEKNNEFEITYNIYLTETDSNTISAQNVKVYLTDDTDTQIVEPILISSLRRYNGDTTNTSYLLYTNTISTSKANTKSIDKYRLRMWLDENSNFDTEYSNNNDIITGTIGEKTFSFKVNVDT